MNTILHFMRHAESSGNAGHPSKDAWTLPLTDLGHLQAAEAARHWVGSGDAIQVANLRVISSPMLRALATAEYVKKAAGSDELEVINGWHEFMAFDFSARGMTTAPQRKVLMADYWNLCDPFTVGEGAGAESFQRFYQRVLAALDETLRRRQKDETTLVVTHGGVIKLLHLLARDGRHDLASSQMMRSWYSAAVVPNAAIVAIGISKVVRS
jgi:broad specificity phosphatase PhoE